MSRQDILPNFLVFGRENRMPIDIILDCPPAEEKWYYSTDEFVEAYQGRMRSAYETVRQQLGQAALKRKDYYDRKVKESEFKPGDWVWYLYPRRRVGKSPKWQRYYTGPYLITRLLLPNDVVLQKSRKSKSFIVHRDKVKLFHGSAPTSWLKPSDDLPVPVEVPVEILGVTKERLNGFEQETSLKQLQNSSGGQEQVESATTSAADIDCRSEEKSHVNAQGDIALGEQAKVADDEELACSEQGTDQAQLPAGSSGDGQAGPAATCIASADIEDNVELHDSAQENVALSEQAEGAEQTELTHCEQGMRLLQRPTDSRDARSRPKRSRRRPAYLINFV